MMGDVSGKTVLVLVMLTIFISVIGTFTVAKAVDEKMQTQSVVHAPEESLPPLPEDSAVMTIRIEK